VDSTGRPTTGSTGIVIDLADASQLTDYRVTALLVISSNVPWRQLLYLAAWNHHHFHGMTVTRPVGLSLSPWSHGWCPVWDFTCRDTLTPSHLDLAVSRPGKCDQ